MNLIENITSNPLQSQTIVLENGETLYYQMYYRDSQKCWYFNTIEYGDFKINSVQIVISPNLLYPWKNKIPFGIACLSGKQREPTQLEDFLSGSARLYVLTPAELLELTNFLNG